MKKISAIFIFLLFFTATAFADKYYKRDFIIYNGSGYVTVDVTDKIVFTITVSSGTPIFCFVPEHIIQDDQEYTIGGFSFNDIRITWENWVGCGDIPEGTTATGTMSSFPPSFNINDDFRIYCGIWDEEDYFDITDTIVSTTSTTTSIFDSRHQKRDFYLYDGNGYVTVDVTNKIIFKITVSNGEPFFCSVLSSIVQNGQEYEINEVIPAPDKMFIEWETDNPPFPYDHYFFGCGEIYEGEIVTGTMDYFPPPFNINDSFRINCNIWDEDDYFDIEAGEQPTTSTTTTSIVPTTTTTEPSSHSTTMPQTTTTTINAGQPGDCPTELIYGNNSEQTELLRYIRDNVLAQTPEGREIIKLYYEWSPAIVRAIEEAPGMKEDIREMVNEFLEATKQ